MKEYPKNIKFKFSWRSYQQRVLNDLETHLDDNHLHIIAPPGSGKTVLGLEVAIRLNKPTLVFAPTIAIKEQWMNRFCKLFLQVDNKPDWISGDIRNPKFLTVTTYQALHAVCTNSTIDDAENKTEEESELVINKKDTRIIDTEEIIKLLKKQNIGTIVIDEAHHLKNEWWKSLSLVKKKLNPTIVGLTATPPYDVSFLEWQRYLELNGSIDFEISVPELIIENDLCPHQDYVYLSEPTDNENKNIVELRAKVTKLYNEIRKDEFLINKLQQSPIFVSPASKLEWIYSNIEVYSAILIYLNDNGILITKNHLEIIGDKKFKTPSQSYEWLEILLNFYLFTDKDNFTECEEHKEKLANRLSRYGVLERKSISFSQFQKINAFLSSSLSKLNSIDKIADIEYNTLKLNLRMVILTDFIRKEYLVNETENNLELNKIGVMPIFEKLRRTNDKCMKIGVLSGSLIIIPQSSVETLMAVSTKNNIFDISTTALTYDSDYVIVTTSEKNKHLIIQLITTIFEQGEIQVLIGTKSLLGEGWDAPTINSLILASFVGSYVLSNQMRGRAIRTDRNNPEKTANIWHLVCVDKTTTDGGSDIELLKRRFKGFVGITNHDEVNIENGIRRIGLPQTIKDQNEISNSNYKTIELAEKRELLKERWNEALCNGVSLTEVIKIPFPEEKDYQEVKSLYYNKTIANLIAFSGAALLSFSEFILNSLFRSIRYMKSLQDFLYWLTAIGIIAALSFGSLFYKTLKVFIKYRDISKDVQQIGEALLESLIKIGIIKSEYSRLTVVATVDKYGVIFCYLDGGTTFEKSAFIKTLHEIIETIQNPRYIIIRKNVFLGLINQKDYHSVPEIIGQNKKSAEYFQRQWNRFVGNCELIYTRTIEGRKILLQSRINSLSSEFLDKTEKINTWK